MSTPIKILFVCIHNSARSQMAEAFANKDGEGDVIAESAGFDPTGLNPLAIEVMEEIGVDITTHTDDSVFELFQQGKRYNYIVTVCDEGAAQKCPIFPGVTHRIHWSFEDPASFEGTQEEKLERTRKVRDAIKIKTHELLELIRQGKVKENAPADWKFNI